MTYHFSTPEFQTDPRTQLIDLAADYARWRPVFPVHTIRNGFCSCGKPDCKRDVGKHPIAWLVPHGHTEATRDEALIRQWWLQEPDANIGLVTGDGLISLDVDGPKGQETLARVRTHYSHQMTIAARAIAAMKLLRLRSKRVAMRRQSLKRQNMRSMMLRCL